MENLLKLFSTKRAMTPEWQGNLKPAVELVLKFNMFLAIVNLVQPILKRRTDQTSRVTHEILSDLDIVGVDGPISNQCYSVHTEMVLKTVFSL